MERKIYIPKTDNINTNTDATRAAIKRISSNEEVIEVEQVNAVFAAGAAAAADLARDLHLTGRTEDGDPNRYDSILRQMRARPEQVGSV